MKKPKSQLFLKDAGGHRVPVSKQVYDAFWQYTNKEDYFMRSLKSERFRYDPKRQIAEFLPSREESLDRLMEAGEEYAEDQPSVEHQVEVHMLMELLLEHLDKGEQQFLRLAFFSDLTEVEVSAILNIPLTTLRGRKAKFLSKCRRILYTGKIGIDSS